MSAQLPLEAAVAPEDQRPDHPEEDVDDLDRRHRAERQRDAGDPQHPPERVVEPGLQVGRERVARAHERRPLGPLAPADHRGDERRARRVLAGEVPGEGPSVEELAVEDRRGEQREQRHRGDRRALFCQTESTPGAGHAVHVIRNLRRGAGGEATNYSNGARGTRTPDLLGAIQALFQLSYSPASASW